MSDITLDEIRSGYNLSKINNNFQKVERVVNDEVLHTEGGNNSMKQQLNMDSNRILNSGYPELSNDVANKRYVDEKFASQVEDVAIAAIQQYAHTGEQRNYEGAHEASAIETSSGDSVQDFIDGVDDSLNNLLASQIKTESDIGSGPVENGSVQERLDAVDPLASVGFLVPDPSDDWEFLDAAIRKVATQQQTQTQQPLAMLPFLPFAGMNMLDLKGRTITLDRTLVLPVASGFGIMNGCITCTDDFPEGDFLITTGAGTDDFNLHKFCMSNMILHGKRRANLFQPDRFLDIHMINCHGYAYHSKGINPIGGNSSHELFVVGGKYEKNTYEDNQAGLSNSGVCFDVQAYDCEFKPAFVGGCEKAFTFGNGEKAQYCTVSGVHVATGMNIEIGVETFSDSSLGLTLTDNYFDGCKLRIKSVAALNITNNRFLNSVSSRPDDNFIELEPLVNGQVFSEVVITGNNFRSNGTAFEAIYLDQSTNIFNGVGGGAIVEGNTVNGNVSIKQLGARKAKFISGAASGTLDFSDSLLFNPNYIQTSIRDADAGQFPVVISSANSMVVSLELNLGLTGTIDVEAYRRV